MSKISFIAAPLTPIVNLVPIAIPRNTKGVYQNCESGFTSFTI
jgi:hypothetical protein